MVFVGQDISLASIPDLRVVDPGTKLRYYDVRLPLRVHRPMICYKHQTNYK